MNRQITSLFLSNLAILFVGSGVFPLLPVYATQFGATPSMIGVYLALTYIAISLGTLLPGWLDRLISQKVLFVSTGLFGVPALILLGYAAAFWQVVVLTAVVWFTGGVGIAFVAVFTGRSAAVSQRGKWFSLIALTTPLGAVIGGSMVGWLVETQGYTVMFRALGLVYALWPLTGLLLVKYEPGTQTGAPRSRAVPGLRTDADGRFSLLVWAVLLVAMTISISRLGLSLNMKASQFSAAAISSTNVIGGLVTIPFVLGLGLLSDRIGRGLLLAIAGFLAALSALLLLHANQLWQFWIVSAAVLVARSLSGSLASALATDILRPEALVKALPRLSSMNWVAGVLGFASSGYVIDTLGANSLYWMATLFSLAAIVITGLMIRRGQESALKQRSAQREGLSSCPEGSRAC